MHPNRSSRRVHSAEFKTKVLAECRQPGASVSAVAVAHGLNPNVVRKWLVGIDLKRMGMGVRAPAPAVARAAPALQFVPVDLVKPSAPPASTPGEQTDIRIELERGSLRLTLRCEASAGPTYAAVDLPGFFGPMISRRMALHPRGTHEKESIH